MAVSVQRESEIMADNRLAAQLFGPKEDDVDHGAWVVGTDEVGGSFQGQI